MRWVRERWNQWRNSNKGARDIEIAFDAEPEVEVIEPLETELVFVVAPEAQTELIRQGLAPARRRDPSFAMLVDGRPLWVRPTDLRHEVGGIEPEEADELFIDAAATRYGRDGATRILTQSWGDDEKVVWAEYHSTLEAINFDRPGVRPRGYFNYARYNAGVETMHTFADDGEYQTQLGQALAERLGVPFLDNLPADWEHYFFGGVSVPALGLALKRKDYVEPQETQLIEG